MQFDNNVPIYLQVIQQIKEQIVKQELLPGDKMPSTRDLAIQYKINPNTASRIYKELEMEEVCFTKRGLGTYVTEDEEKLNRIREEMAAELVQNFIVGMNHLGFTKEELIDILTHQYDELIV